MIKKTEKWDLINEGGEGYRPSPKGKAVGPQPETRDQILHRLEIEESSTVRGLVDNSALIVELRAELARLEEEEEGRFRAEWTRKTSRIRREYWNWLIQNDEFDWPLNWRRVRAAEESQGWTWADLKKAVQFHGLNKEEGK